MFRHGATYAGHPSVCAAALATLDIYEREDIIRRGRDLEQPLHDALAPLAEHPGLRRGARRARLPGRAVAAARAVGGRDGSPPARARRACSCAPLLGGVAVSPPLICEQEHIDLLAAGITAGLDDVAAV